MVIGKGVVNGYKMVTNGEPTLRKKSLYYGAEKKKAFRLRKHGTNLTCRIAQRNFAWCKHVTSGFGFGFDQQNGWSNHVSGPSKKPSSDDLAFGLSRDASPVEKYWGDITATAVLSLGPRFKVILMVAAVMTRLRGFLKVLLFFFRWY